MTVASVNHDNIRRALQAAEEAAELLRIALGDGDGPAGETDQEPADLRPLKVAASELGISEATARRWAKQGYGARIGGRWFLDVARVRRGRP